MEGNESEPSWIRTNDPILKRDMLYQLSYRPPNPRAEATQSNDVYPDFANKGKKLVMLYLD